MFRKLKSIFLEKSPINILEELQLNGYNATLAQFGSVIRFDENVLLLIDGICLAEFKPEEIQIRDIQKCISLLGFETPIGVVPSELGSRLIKMARKTPGLKIA